MDLAEGAMNYRIVYLLTVAVVLAGLFRLLGLYFVRERSPLGVAAFLIVGLVTGWLAGQLLRGRGHAILGDLFFGIVGALFGGLVAGVLLPGADLNLSAAIVAAFLGACIFIAIFRALPGRSTELPTPPTRIPRG
jgi:uncharacterized membrane protein YeaQ/YmgE (transglycosylase-associated protein family)